MAWHWKPRIATHDSVLFLPRLLSTHACVLQPLPQYFSARNLGALKGPGIGYLKKTPQYSSVPGRFPFNKNFGLKFWKFHVPNGTVHSGFTDPFQATACLLIVPAASRIQKSGTGDNNFVKWKGLSVGPTEMSGLVKVNHLQRLSQIFPSDRTEMARSIWFLIKICGYGAWMESVPEKLGAINLWCMKCDINVHA